MSTMDKTESFERFSEGLKKAASRARELAAAQHNLDWTRIALSIDGLLDKGTRYYKNRAMSENEIRTFLEQHQKEIKT